MRKISPLVVIVKSFTLNVGQSGLSRDTMWEIYNHFLKILVFLNLWKIEKPHFSLA